MPVDAPHVSFVSFAIEVVPTGTTHVMIVETSLHLNPRHPAYNKAAVNALVSAAQDYSRDHLDGPSAIRLVSTRSDEI